MNKWICILASIVLFSFCTKKEESIHLFYTKNYPGDNWQNHRTGLLWAFSYLGASLPEGSLDKALEWTDSSHFILRPEKLGFNEQALQAFSQVLQKIKSSKEYQKQNAADLGLLLSLTIGSSWHYYQITGVPSRITGFFRKPIDQMKVFKARHSTVAKHERLIRFNVSDPDPCNWIFIAEEGEGSHADNSFRVSAYEVFNVMPNGQLRFAVYDHKGELMAASPKHLGEAGKPAKCLWCHEISIQPLFIHNEPEKESLSPDDFLNEVSQAMKILDTYRKNLRSDIDFKKTQDHTQMELVYISYMRPSVQRLSQEWKMPATEVEQIVKSISKTEHEEFKFLGPLMQRKKLRDCPDYLPDDIREPGIKEPDFFN